MVLGNTNGPCTTIHCKLIDDKLHMERVISMTPLLKWVTERGMGANHGSCHVCSIVV